MHEKASGDAKLFGVMTLVYIGYVSITSIWCIMMTHVTEIYPTVVRGQATGWCYTMARIGGIAAPFLIPDQENTVYICYIIMGGLSLLIGMVVTQLPETKGKRLKGDFDDEQPALGIRIGLE